MTNKQKTYLTVALVALFIVVWTALLWYWGADTIVARLGVQNGYLLAFTIAVLGGVSTLTAAPYYTTLVTLAVGGLHPLVLGAIAGTGAMIGDMVFFYLGQRSRPILPQRVTGWLERLSSWLAGKPRWFAPVLIYAYIGFTPLPNDIIMVLAGFTQLRYRTIVIADWLGNITLAIFVALAGRYGFSFF